MICAASKLRAFLVIPVGGRGTHQSALTNKFYVAGANNNDELIVVKFRKDRILPFVNSLLLLLLLLIIIIIIIIINNNDDNNYLLFYYYYT
jgi:hypothetical protein